MIPRVTFRFANRALMCLPISTRGEPTLCTPGCVTEHNFPPHIRPQYTISPTGYYNPGTSIRIHYSRYINRVHRIGYITSGIYNRVHPTGYVSKAPGSGYDSKVRAAPIKRPAAARDKRSQDAYAPIEATPQELLTTCDATCVAVATFST